MTGHGRGSAEGDGRSVTVEVRAVNHRFLDVKLRANLDPDTERRASEIIRRRLERGALTVSLREEGPAARAVRVDLGFALNVHAALVELGQKIGHQGPIEGDALFLAALDAALAALVDMRRAEGEILARDLQARLDRLEALAGEITQFADVAPSLYSQRLRERLERLAADLPPERVAAEAAALADRIDVTEELVRLRAHVAQARGLIASDGSVGRKLDFLVQEMGREVNTVGSKSQSLDISRRVVEAKAELERVREQVQNVE